MCGERRLSLCSISRMELGPSVLMYYQSMFPALTTFLDQALHSRAAAYPPTLFAGLLNSEDYTVVLMMRSGGTRNGNEKISVICREMSLQQTNRHQAS